MTCTSCCPWGQLNLNLHILVVFSVLSRRFICIKKQHLLRKLRYDVNHKTGCGVNPEGNGTPLMLVLLLIGSNASFPGSEKMKVMLSHSRRHIKACAQKGVFWHYKNQVAMEWNARLSSRHISFFFNE